MACWLGLAWLGSNWLGLARVCSSWGDDFSHYTRQKIYNFPFLWTVHTYIQNGNLMYATVEYRLTEGIQTQTELSPYLYAASFACRNDEMNNIFDYMKRRCCEGIFFYLLNIHQQVRPKSVTPCHPSPSKEYSFGKQCQGKMSPLSWDCHPTITPEWSNSCTIH